MTPILRRIAIHGVLTAVALAVMGYLFAELAGVWLRSGNESRGANDADDPTVTSLRWRAPLIMAVWGFAFVVIGEIAIHLWRGEPKPVPPPPDEGERLLEELLQQAEAANAKGVTPAAGDGIAHAEQSEPIREDQ